MEESEPAGVDEFQMILNEMLGDDSMDNAQVVYEKLIHRLKNSLENEKRVLSKCRELEAEIAISNAAKDAANLKNETTTASLKMELDKAWKMVDAEHDKQKSDRETIRSLTEDVAKLMQAAEEQAGLSMAQEQIYLQKMDDELNKQRDTLLPTIESLRENLNKAATAYQEIEAQRDSSLETISRLQEEIQVQQNKISQEMRLKEKLDKEVKQLHIDVDSKMREIKALTVQSQRSKAEQQKVKLQLKELKILNERSSREVKQVQVKKVKLQQECEQMSSAKDQLSLENQQISKELKMREEKVSQLHQEIAKQVKMREVTHKKLHQVEQQKADVVVQRETLKAQITALEKDLESSQKQVDADKKAIDELTRERAILNDNMIKATQSIDKQQNIVKLLEHDRKTLENEIGGYCQEAQKQCKIIQQMEKERNHHINETSNLAHRVQDKMRDIQIKEVEIFDWRKKATEAECKLKQYENLLESVTAEGNLSSKNLIEAQEDIAEMKRKMKTMNSQVTQLRDEITRNEQALVKDQQEYKCLARENDALQGELQANKQQLEEAKQCIDSQKAEQLQLQKIISDVDAEQIQQRKQLEQVTAQRDNLGKQLLRRNEECALLYEKIRLQQSIMNKGDVHYNQQVEDIRLLKVEIKRLEREKSILKKTIPNIEELRHELFHLQRELQKERMRNSVLEEQLKPINIHRWRQLEGSDPGKYELIQKVQCLQKQLITKSQEVIEHELLLQEKEKQYLGLKNILVQRPGTEAAEQLQQCRWTIREKDKKLQGLTAEVRILDSKVNEYKNENERLEKELGKVKKMYVSQKKLLSEQKASVEQCEPLPQLSSKPHFTGGGFRINNPGKR